MIPVINALRRLMFHFHQKVLKRRARQHASPLIIITTLEATTQHEPRRNSSRPRRHTAVCTGFPARARRTASSAPIARRRPRRWRIARRGSDGRDRPGYPSSPSPADRRNGPRPRSWPYSTNQCVNLDSLPWPRRAETARESRVRNYFTSNDTVTIIDKLSEFVEMAIDDRFSGKDSRSSRIGAHPWGSWNAKSSSSVSIHKRRASQEKRA